MQKDFHYYATYCAAVIAGYSHEESLTVAYSAQFVDCCSRTLLAKVDAPSAAATTQLQLELMNVNTDPIALQDITRIWSSFHFLPGDLYAQRSRCSKRYLRKYRLICNTNSSLLADTVELARGKSLEAVGLAMHVLCDTWAHRYFAGTPSLVINNTNGEFYELIPEGDDLKERKIRFNNNPTSADDIDKGLYTNSLFQGNENSIMNLGHGRAGHLPDYSFARYRYMPSWGEYKLIVKNNPEDYRQAFMQMVYALKCLREKDGSFETDRYAIKETEAYMNRIDSILNKRQLDACQDWKMFAEELSGSVIPDFTIDDWEKEFLETEKEKREDTALGRFVLAALAQKSMVTNRIFSSGSLLAGFSVDPGKWGFRGIRDFRLLLKANGRSAEHD